MNKNESKGVRLGLLETLQLIFIVLKLCNLIDWSWPIVLIPIWVGLGLIVLVALLTIAVDYLN